MDPHMCNNLCSFEVLMLSILSVEKTFSSLFFIVFSLNNTRKSCAPFTEFLFSHERFPEVKILSRSHLRSTSPPPQPKNHPEKVSTLPNNQYCNVNAGQSL